MGYLYCLSLLRKIPAGTLLINQHVVEPFSFNTRGLDHMTAILTKRKELLAELLIREPTLSLRMCSRSNGTCPDGPKQS